MSTENQNIQNEEQDLNQVIDNEVNEQEQQVVVEEDTLETKLAAEKDRYLRLFAEFENYKRRTAKERIEMFSTASEGVMLSLLPVLDDFDRAIVELDKLEDNEYLAGVRLISTKLKDTLVSKGLTEVELTKGDDFNADVAEAVTQIPAGDEFKGKVFDVIERGYKLGDKIIRFPKVVIGQ